jgi:DNA-binding transcriptional ArsR family regulator
MTTSDRDLVAALRAELAAIDPARACDRHAELAGLGTDLRVREPAIARLAVRLGAGRAGSATFDWASADWASAPEHCRTAYLRGRFLAHGSLSLAAARTHLEFVLPPEKAPVLARWLGESGLPASWRIRRAHGVVTWKSAETVGMFLRRVGAGGALLELEARQVARAMRGDLNRLLNAESANLQRAVAAAGRQLVAIGRLEADGRLARQPHAVRLIAAARRETPESTFSELADRLSLHRSTVQRALERLERLALHDDEAIGHRRPSGRGAARPAIRRRVQAPNADRRGVHA